MKNIIVAVIGAGPAGMIAAGAAATHDTKVYVIEKNKNQGKKLLITGKGRCNITNHSSLDNHITNIPGNGKFLYSAYNTFFVDELLQLLKKYGLNYKVERGNRVFPISDKSHDVLAALKKYINRKNVNRLTNNKAISIKRLSVDHFVINLESGKTIKANKVIIATGGKSYSKTGSTGDGYKFASKFGHKITELYPSLVPLIVEEGWVKQLQGLTLKNVLITAYNNNKKIGQKFGEMIFTENGLSGPVVLELSRDIVPLINKSDNIFIYINLKPALSNKQINSRLLKEFEIYNNKIFKNSLSNLFPSSLIPVIISISEIPSNKLVNQITKLERNRLIDLLTNLKFKVIGHGPFDEAIITRGGVPINEINSKTMESKIINNLYFAGEIIDYDAYTGGYNLQGAFSTGFIAGKNSSLRR